MYGSTLTMLLQLRNGIGSPDCLDEHDESSLDEHDESSLDAPQFRMQSNFGEKLKELLRSPSAAQFTPMD